MTEKIQAIHSTADALSAEPAEARVLVGFDGFIDEIVRLVDTRRSADDYTAIATIEEFGRRILSAAGLSCNIEMVPEQVKLGGNGPIMANNLVEQGFDVLYCGAIGAGGKPHKVFRDFAERCREVITLCDPAHTDAVEFDDGKVMLGKMNTLPRVNWDNLIAQVPREDLKAKLNGLDLIGCVNWTMLPEMNSILRGVGDLLDASGETPKVFVDLTDPRKRSAEDIAEVLEILVEMRKSTEVILGLNENESRQVAEVRLGREGDDLSARARALREDMGLSQVVIHPTRSAAVATEEGQWYVEGPYTPKPKLTTGAGDNFNAGYCTGLLAGLSPERCLITGVCSSGFYVRNARSATREELTGFVHHWAERGGGEMP